MRERGHRSRGNLLKLDNRRSITRGNIHFVLELRMCGIAYRSLSSLPFGELFQKYTLDNHHWASQELSMRSGSRIIRNQE